jgi:hypothetical protein
MSISTLSKITVPLANDASAVAQGMLMPKLQYRFRVTLENFGVSVGEVTELTKQVIDVTRPNLTFEEIPIEIYNSRAYLAGKHTWDMITLNLREDVTGSVQKLVGEQLQKQFDFFEQSSAASGIDYKFTTRIEILDGGNGAYAPTADSGVLETWELYGCFIQNANYNSLAYATNEPVTVTLSIRYDNAIQTPQGTGVGVNVGRGIAGEVGTLVTGG